ncbi:MAG: hypothetical protein LJE91_14855 [Gammaproteobacteria bacterium]|jgi:hypothetical protein|nr:hypothetical protein [Gammaproteobacteria bacterium]
MSTESTAELNRQFHETVGALDLILLLREEMGQWLEEAQDDSKRETLENVVGHLESIEEEYVRRRDELQGRVKR